MVNWEYTTGGRCEECKQPFEGKHLVSKTTCGPKCRKRRERRQKDAYSAHVVIVMELQKLRDAIKRGETIPDYLAQLQRIKSEVNDLLLLARDPDALSKHEMMEAWARKL